jgi:hypothetical protein
MRSISIFAVSAAALIIGGYGGWVLWQGVAADAWQSVLFGAAALVAGIAMLARQPWSRFLVYAVVAFFVVSYAYMIVGAVQAGAWAEYDGLRMFLSLVPGLAMVAVALICAFIAGRFLRPRAQQA